MDGVSKVFDKDHPVIYRSSLIFFTFFAIAFQARAADAPPAISAERIKADVAYLASDRLEGRGPGTRGEELTTEYLADEFKKAGLKPVGRRGTYFQPVPLVRVVTSPEVDAPGDEGKRRRSTSPARRTSPARARRRRNSRSSTPRRSSSATASPRPSSSGTTTRR